MKRFLFSLIALAFLTCSAEAANRFWVGGTGTWDTSDTTHWSTTTGGGGGASVPGTSDIAIFDGSSGGGTVTAAATLTNINGLTTTAFTGTIDFATNNPSFTIGGSGWADTGAGGTHTINMGSGTWTISGTAGSIDVSNTNLTLNQGTSTVAFTAATPSSTRAMTLGTKHLATVTVAAQNAAYVMAVTGAATIDSFTITAPGIVSFQSGTTITIGTFTLNGSAFNSMVDVFPATSTSNCTVSISTAMTATWGAFRRITFAGAGSFSITNSMDLGGNSGATISGPSSGGGGIIGG